MTGEMEDLERRIDRLRAAVRRAAGSGERDRVRSLRAELREAERLWDESLAELEAEPAAGLAADAAVRRGTGGGEAGVAAGGIRAGHLLPVREQVHQALTLLGAPAAPRLIVAVHDAFYAGRLPGARLTSLRRDEERSFRSAPYARPYYLCAALTADLLAPARGLLAISTWPMSLRVVGPLSPRVDYLTGAIRAAERYRDLSDVSVNARRLLWRFAVNIPRAAENFATMSPEQIVIAARAELAVHERADSEVRAAAARRAIDQLEDVEQLFGAGLRPARRASAGS